MIYVGAGTSGRLGVLDASECPPTFSVPPELVRGVIAGGAPALTRSIEGAEDSPEKGAESLKELGVSSKDCVLGIATGATTPYVPTKTSSTGAPMSLSPWWWDLKL